MTWLTPGDTEHPALRLRALLPGEGAIVVPGVFHGLSALLARRAGAEIVYLSGAAFSASMGLPDVGLLTLDDVVRQARSITRVSDVPLIVDADTGFGGPLNAMRAVRELEEAGAAAIQLEDQVDPKRCGHLEGKQVTSAEAFAEKVAAARSASENLVVVARTDARATHGFEEAVRRGLVYREAGADVIFPEALESEDELAAYARHVPGPLLANMTEFGKGPLLPSSRLGELGYRLVIFPVSAARIFGKAAGAFYEMLLRTGTQVDALERMMTREELYQLIGYDDYAELDRSLTREPKDERT